MYFRGRLMNLTAATLTIGTAMTLFFNGFEKLGRHVDAAIVYLSCHRVSPGKHQVSFHKLCNNISETPKNAVVNLFISKLEEDIRAYG